MPVAIDVEEVEAEDVVEAALKVKGGRGQRLAVARQDLLRTRVAVYHRGTPMHFGVEVMVDAPGARS
jgi:hypothetical protein